MAPKARIVTVTTAPTALNVAQSDGQPGSSAALYVPAGGQTVFIGGSDVTAAAGYPRPAGSEYFADIDERAGGINSAISPGETIYGIVVSGSQAVNVFQLGV